MRGAWLVAGAALAEAVRRRVFAVVAVLTAGFLALYTLGARQAFGEAGEVDVPGVDGVTVVGSTMLGLAMFVVLFLGTVLAAFLVLGAVRGDAERGLLQPLVVRPVGRTALLLGRFAAAGAVAGAYVLVVYLAALGLTAAVGDGWLPDRVVGPGVRLAGAVVVVAALGAATSVVLASTANGIAVFMAFGAGLTAGLLGQIGEAIDSGTLQDVGLAVSVALPFEALYTDALAGLTADVSGPTGFVVELGPFGGGEDLGLWLVPWAVAWTALVLAAGAAAFASRDL